MSFQNLYESEKALLNNNSYKSNDIYSNQKFMFNFINRKFYWKELMKIRTKNIESTGDVSILSPYVENILYTRLDLENLDLLSEEYIIQLITLLQLIGQYLVYTQKKLESENYNLKQNIIYLKNNLIENEKYQSIIDNLNRQIQEKDFLIRTYQNMTQNGNDINDINSEDKDINMKNISEISYIKKTYYYCNICLGKKFKTQKYLDEHMIRRHYNFKDLYINKKEIEEKKEQDELYRLEFNEKINLIKSQYDALFMQKEDNREFDILNKKFELLQNQIMLQNNKINKEKNKSENEVKIKYDDLLEKYNILLKKLEENERKAKLDKDFDFEKKSSKNEGNIKISKKDSKEDLINKKIEEKNNILEINQINTNISNINIINNNKSEEKEIDNINEIINKSDSKIINEKNKEEDNKININQKNENEISFKNDNNKSKIDIINSSIKEEENKKFLTNDGNETIHEPKNISIQKDEEKKKSINDNKEINLNPQNNELKKSNSTKREEKIELNISRNSKKDEDNILKNSKTILKSKNEKEKERDDINEIEIKNIPLNENLDNLDDKLKLFYHQYEQRDKNCLSGEITNYKKTDIPKKSISDIKEILKEKKYSEDYIKQYKNYDYLNKQLQLDELFNSLKKHQNNNQMILKDSSQNENNNIKITQKISKEIKEEDKLIDNNQNKEENKKNEIIIESSYIKGFDLTKSTK